ncbi:MAG: hypothetical protein LBD84_06140 [Campylobacteraceae bacterium]|jgi:hypothetical protein|nr:hypothetical protein [Campylobacteraceae bacterium]
MRTWGKEQLRRRVLYMIDVLDFSEPIGDPMVEIGRQGLVVFCEKNKFTSFEELKKAIEKLFNIYVFKTSGRISQIFSSNSKFTHNSTKDNLDERLRQATELYEVLINGSENGYCLSCGNKDNLCSVNKTILPLTTGNSNVNFTSNFSNQFLICKKCMTSLFFMPINMQKVAGRMAFLISDNEEINRYWSEKNFESFKFNKLKQFDSLIDSKTNIFENFIYETIERLQEEELFGNITFYLISNVDKGSDVDIVHINKNQIYFIHKVAPNFLQSKLSTDGKSEWNSLIIKYSSMDKDKKYRTRNETVDDKKITIKFDDEVIRGENYKAAIKYFNPLLSSFIQGKSILGFFLQSRSSWFLTSIYLKEIMNMREERLEVIKKVADKLQIFNEDEKYFIDKIIFPIEKTKSVNEFREKLRLLMRKYLAKTQESLFTVDELVFQILPAGENWQETKDIFLIALYEKLGQDVELEDITLEEGDSENE